MLILVQILKRFFTTTKPVLDGYLTKLGEDVQHFTPRHFTPKILTLDTLPPNTLPPTATF